MKSMFALYVRVSTCTYIGIPLVPKINSTRPDYFETLIFFPKMSIYCYSTMQIFENFGVIVSFWTFSDVFKYTGFSKTFGNFGLVRGLASDCLVEVS